MTGHTGVRLYPGSNLIMRAGMVVARTYSEDDADLIIQAVNAVPELVKALEGLCACYNLASDPTHSSGIYYGQPLAYKNAWGAARVALAALAKSGAASAQQGI